VRRNASPVVGLDVNPKCKDALEVSKQYFSDSQRPTLVIGSILNSEDRDRIRTSIGQDGFDIVHSWGVLHHTGRMDAAVEAAAALVKPGGTFVIALYNRHWSSR